MIMIVVRLTACLVQRLFKGVNKLTTLIRPALFNGIIIAKITRPDGAITDTL